MLEVAKKVVRQSGYSKLSARDVAAAAGRLSAKFIITSVPSKAWCWRCSNISMRNCSIVRASCSDDVTLKVSEQWEGACDYLDEDIASGYVRILQELIAANWADPAIGKVVRAGLLGWSDAVRSLAWRAERELRGLGPFSSEELGALIGSAFLGAERTYLLGLEREGSPRARVAMT